MEIQDYVNEIKQYFAQTYDSRSAQKSPPHITLQPPFEWQLDAVPVLEQYLKTFADTRTPVPITLSRFGAFVPRVIYMNVLKTPELLALQKDLMAYVEASLGIVEKVSKTRPFVPHMTLAFHDLTEPNFRKAWPEFQNRQLEFQFMASHLALLIHDGKEWNVSKGWNVSAEFPFLAQPI